MPVEFVDSIEDMIIGNMLAYVENATSGVQLTGYQKNALVSRCFNMGPSGAIDAYYTPLNFVTYYQQYWKEEDDQFEEKNKNANFNHQLYKQFMSLVFYSNGVQSQGLINRRKSEWTLFQTGYYDRIDKWHVDVSTGGVTNDEEAKEMQKYIENELIHTQYHHNDATYQSGPFAKWWSSGYNQLSKFQCTWWAWGRASMYLETNGVKYKVYPTQYGDGGEYYDVNIRNGYFNYGSTPKPNSIISWKQRKQ